MFNSYDELPYSCHPVQWSHPDNLACKAILHGLNPAAPHSARVLEIGCGNGGNLLPLAQSLPQAEFFGIDYAARQITKGQAIANTVGLSNLTLIAQSVTELDAQLGDFDFIICHGVYSWVAPPIQQAILAAIKHHLRTGGIAYISYNVYPGWHLRELVRDILCHQTAGLGDPSERVQKARRYLDFLIQFTPDPQGLYAQALRRERDILSKTPDTYLFHEHLEDINQPLYFHEFAQRLANQKLQFLCEANFHPEQSNFSDELHSLLQSQSRNRIDYEQQIDFLCNGTFRRSLLCHDHLSVTNQPSSVAVQHTRMRSRTRPVSATPDILSNTPEEFSGAHGATVTTSHPLIKAALAVLSDAWPQSLSLPVIQEQASQRLGISLDPLAKIQNTELLAQAMLRCYQTDIVQFTVAATNHAVTQPDTPTAPPLARWQALQQEPITNLLHETVDLNDFDRLTLSLLDGSLDRQSICAKLIDEVIQGTLTLQHQGQPVHDPELIAQVVNQSLEQTLHKLLDLTLLSNSSTPND